MAVSSAPSALYNLPIAAALDEISVGLVQSLASAMVQLMTILEGVQSPAVDAAQIANSGSISSLALPEDVSTAQLSPADLLSSPSLLTLDTAFPSATTATLTTLPSSEESAQSSTTSIADSDKNRKRALPILAGLQSLAAGLGAALPIGAQVQTPSVTVGATASVYGAPVVPSAGLSASSIGTPGSAPVFPSATLPQVPTHIPAPSLPGLPLPAQALLPSQYYSVVNNAPIIGTAPLQIAAGSTVLSIVTSIPLPDKLPTLLQGVKDAVVANISEAVTNVPLIGQAEQVLAILQLLAIMNVGQFGSLATLTSLPAVQSAVTVINQPDLATVVNVLESKSIVYSTATDGLLSNIVGFVQMVEKLVPKMSNIKAVVAYIILDQLGLTAARDVLDGTLINSLPGGGGAA